MQINLKQREIEAALRMYVSHQGINLNGKEVAITFTAGRKEGGLTADVSIEDITIPGFTDAEVGEQTGTANVVQLAAATIAAAASTPAVNAEKPAVQTTAPEATEAKAPAAAKEDPPFEPDAPKAEGEGAKAEDKPKTKVASLFG